MKKIKKGDHVLALCGNEKGRSGVVLSVNEDKVLVQGLNVRKKHVKAQRNQKGQLLDIEAPIHISNLRNCTSEGKPLKLKTRVNPETNARELFYMDEGKAVSYRTAK